MLGKQQHDVPNTTTSVQIQQQSSYMNSGVKKQIMAATVDLSSAMGGGGLQRNKTPDTYGAAKTSIKGDVSQ